MTKETLNADLINQIIKMDGELDKDPTYKKYEKIFATQKIKESIAKNFGIEADLVPQEMVDDLLVFAEENSSGNGLTPELVVSRKDEVMELVEAIIDVANWDEEYELSHKLKVFVDLLKQL
jgi:hypothetical protein